MGPTVNVLCVIMRSCQRCCDSKKVPSACYVCALAVRAVCMSLRCCQQHVAAAGSTSSNAWLCWHSAQEGHPGGRVRNKNK